MVLGHHLKKDDLVLDILVEYNPETTQVDELISIIAMDISDGAEIDLTGLSATHPAMIRYLVNSVDWERIYKDSKMSIALLK